MDGYLTQLSESSQISAIPSNVTRGGYCIQHQIRQLLTHGTIHTASDKGRQVPLAVFACTC